MIPNQTVEEIFQKARIEEVVSDFLTLKKRGVNLLGNCPFHNEKTPSFTVSPAKNIFKCFGCGKSGTPVGFIMEHENMSYSDALRYLANKYNVLINEVQKTPEQDESARQRESLLLINEFVTKHFNSNLNDTEYGQNIGGAYFKERGYHKSTIEKFGLGFAFPDGYDLVNTAKAKAYNIDLLKMIGLVNINERDFFTNRVMFPIYGLSGRVLGFGGRALSTNEKTPKYLNSIESEIYNKSKILYGFFQGKNAIRKQENCFLVEGYTDVISLHQAGIEIAVASSGTSLTLEQAQLIKRFTDNVTILYDGDNAGIKAAQRGIDILLSQNLNVHIVILPDNDDPDSYLKTHGSQALLDYIENTKKDFILFKTNEVLEQAKNDPIKKVALAQDIIHSIAQIPDALKRSIYAASSAKTLDIREEVILSELFKTYKKETEKQRLEEIRDQRQQKRNASPGDSIQPTDNQTDIVNIVNENHPFQTILKILILHGNRPFGPDNPVNTKTQILSDIAEDLDALDHPLYISILKEYQERESAEINNSAEYYMNHSNGDIRNMVLSWIDPGYEFSKNWIEKHHHPLQYQPLPEENYVNEYNYALLLFKLFALNKLVIENKKKINEMIEAKDDAGLLIQLKAQVLIDKERSALSSKIGMVIVPR